MFVLAAIGLVPDRRAAVAVCLIVAIGALALSLVAERHDWFEEHVQLARPYAHADRRYNLRAIRAGSTRIWMDSLDDDCARPVLGFGPDGYQISGCCNRTVAQPHNRDLEILLEFRRRRLAALAWTATALFGPRVREIAAQTTRKQRDPIQAAALAIIVGVAAFSLIDGLLYFPVPLVNFALVCAIVFSTPSGNSRNRSKSVDRAAIRSPASSFCSEAAETSSPAAPPP